MFGVWCLRNKKQKTRSASNREESTELRRQPEDLLMSKRKADDAAAPQLDAAAQLLAVDVNNAVAAAAGSMPTLERLLEYAAKLSAAATKEKKNLKRKASVCWDCKGPAVDNCDTCDNAVCDECTRSCKECERTLCGDCEKTCDFDDMLGGEGCGEPVCDKCWVTTECERDVGGCSDCLADYSCPDCDQCAGY